MRFIWGVACDSAPHAVSCDLSANLRRRGTRIEGMQKPGITEIENAFQRKSIRPRDSQVERVRLLIPIMG
jgi:hypothetical protein